jgi:hypothetical protein
MRAVRFRPCRRRLVHWPETAFWERTCALADPTSRWRERFLSRYFNACAPDPALPPDPATNDQHPCPSPTRPGGFLTSPSGRPLENTFQKTAAAAAQPLIRAVHPRPRSSAGTPASPAVPRRCAVLSHGTGHHLSALAPRPRTKQSPAQHRACNSYTYVPHDLAATAITHGSITHLSSTHTPLQDSPSCTAETAPQQIHARLHWLPAQS